MASIKIIENQLKMPYFAGASTFMEGALEGLRDEACLPFLDDMIAFSTTFEDHISNFRKVLRRLQEKGVILKPSKCRLFQKEASYLGRIVSADGHRVDPSGTKAVTDIRHASPKTVREVRKIVGLLGYYRRDIQDFSRIAWPLYNLLKGPEAEAENGQGDRWTRQRKAPTQPPPSYPVQWEERHHHAMTSLSPCTPTPRSTPWGRSFTRNRKGNYEWRVLDPGH